MTPDDIIRLLDELGQRLGPAGERVFALAVRQVYAEALVAILAFAVVVAVGAIAAPRLARWASGGDTYSADRPLAVLMLALPYGMSVIVLGCAALLTLPGLLNPEYAALSRLLSEIR